MICRMFNKSFSPPQNLAATSVAAVAPADTSLFSIISSQLDESSEVDKNSVVDISSVKLVDESSVIVENTGLKLEELDEKAVVYQSVFSLRFWEYINGQPYLM